MNTYQKIKEMCPMLYWGKAVWVGNQEQNKPLKSFFDPQLIEFLGDDVRNGYIIEKQLKQELEQRFLESRDYALVRGFAVDIIELLYSEISLRNENYSLLGLFGTYSDYVTHGLQKYNTLYKEWYSPQPQNITFISSFRTSLYIKNALYSWSSILINYIRKYSPELFNLYEVRFREIIDFSVPFIPPSFDEDSPATSTQPPASDRPAITPGFDTYIVEAHRAKLMPFLEQNYTGLEPRDYAYLIGALIELRAVPESVRHANKSAVHRALSKSFEVVFPLQSWNAAINRLDVLHNDEDKRNVAEYVRQIRPMLTPPATE